jgi:hypothetical protein
MRFSIATALTLAAGAFAGVVTETVTDYTTYCPEATSIVHGGSTYSVSTVRSLSDFLSLCYQYFRINSLFGRRLGDVMNHPSHHPGQSPNIPILYPLITFHGISLTPQQPGSVTLTGSFTVTRPLVTQTVTQCNKW